MITEATRKCGGVYLYSNLQGGDGDRLLYDGGSLIVVNGEVVAQGSQFSLNDGKFLHVTSVRPILTSYLVPNSRGSYCDGRY